MATRLRDGVLGLLLGAECVRDRLFICPLVVRPLFCFSAFLLIRLPARLLICCVYFWFTRSSARPLVRARGAIARIAPLVAVTPPPARVGTYEKVRPDAYCSWCCGWGPDALLFVYLHFHPPLHPAVLMSSRATD